MTAGRPKQNRNLRLVRPKIYAEDAKHLMTYGSTDAEGFRKMLFRINELKQRARMFDVLKDVDAAKRAYDSLAAELIAALLRDGFLDEARLREILTANKIGDDLEKIADERKWVLALLPSYVKWKDACDMVRMSCHVNNVNLT